MCSSNCHDLKVFLLHLSVTPVSVTKVGLQLFCLSNISHLPDDLYSLAGSGISGLRRKSSPCSLEGASWELAVGTTAKGVNCRLLSERCTASENLFIQPLHSAAPLPKPSTNIVLYCSIIQKNVVSAKLILIQPCSCMLYNC